MEEKTTTVISLTQPTPAWVNWIFRIQFVLNKAALFIIGASMHVSANDVKEWITWLAAIDIVVWGLGRFVGQKKEDYEKD